MKYLVLLVVVLGVVWWMFGRRKPPLQPPGSAGGRPDSSRTQRREGREGRRDRKDRDSEPQKMLACAHCGVHLPQSETTPDGQGRRYCSEAHRVAGPAPD